VISLPRLPSWIAENKEGGKEVVEEGLDTPQLNAFTPYMKF